VLEEKEAKVAKGAKGAEGPEEVEEVKQAEEKGSVDRVEVQKQKTSWSVPGPVHSGKTLLPRLPLRLPPAVLQQL